jgi:hypothetical protein
MPFRCEASDVSFCSQPRLSSLRRSLHEVERQIAQQHHNPYTPGSNVAFANYTTYAWVYQW